MPTQTDLPAAVVFDMDGVMIDSNPFHLAKWVDFLKERGVSFVEADLPKLILGKRNDTALRYFLDPNLTQAQCRELSEELEARFRKAFRLHARPLPGLTALIEECHRANIPMAVASSAMRANIDFVVDALGLRRYFKVLASGDEVIHPKPDPEIYLKAAGLLQIPPSACVAFEDSFVGVEAAHRAGMKCVAIASSFPVEELRQQTHAVRVANSFEELSLAALRGLFNGRA